MTRSGARAIGCERAARWLYPALDGALGAGEQRALEAHLAACAPCRELRQREVAFRAQLARLRAVVPPAPPSLHARLRAALAPRPEAGAGAAPGGPGPGAGSPGRGRHRGRRLTRRTAWSVLAAAGAAVALAAVLAEPFVRPRSATPALVRSIAAQQAALAEGRLPLEMTSGSAGTVAAWLRPRLGFPVDLPPVVVDDVEIVGTRLTELGAAEAAAVLYRVGGREVALFTFPAEVLRSSASAGGSGSTELEVAGHHFRLYRLGRLTVTLWARGPIGYALAVPADLAASRGCAVCHVGEENRRLEQALAPGLAR